MNKILFLLLFVLHTLNATAIIDKEYIQDFEIEYLYDKSKDLTIDQVSNSKFEKTIPSQFSLGYLNGYLWYKITITNQSIQKNFVLYFTEPHFDQFNLYSFENNKWKKNSNGIDVAMDNRDIYDHNPAFNLQINPNETKIYYVQSSNKMGSFGEFKIYERTAFFEEYKFINKSLYLLYFGGLIIIIIFNGFLYIKLKDYIYLYYAGYILFFSIFIFIFSGISLYVGLQAFHYELHASVPIFIIFLILFSIRYLQIEKYNKNLLKIFYLLSIFYFILSVLIFININPWYEVLSSSASIVLLLLSGSAIYVWIKGHKEAKYYILALSIYIVTVALFSSLANGWVENNDINRYAFLFGSYLEVILFSLMLANRFYVSQHEKLIIQDKLINAQIINKRHLDKQIDLRTQELVTVNKKLIMSVKEKELILKELHHRVKNNFHMITSLLWLESQKLDDQKAQNKLLELSSRMKSMSNIHEYLYNSESLSLIDSVKYIDNIIGELDNIYSNQNIQIDTDIDLFEIEANSAISLSVIINEIITNSIKYNNTTDNKCFIFISLKKKDTSIQLIIKDNGKGFDYKKEYDGLGLKLVQQFSKQLTNSHYEFDTNEGTVFTLTFKEE